MPCTNPNHEHAGWPVEGEQELVIEPCETHCGWCKYQTKNANNLRVHARRHIANENDTNLQGIKIGKGKAGRKRVQMEKRRFPSPRPYRPESRNGELDQSLSWDRWDELVKIATEPDVGNKMLFEYTRPNAVPLTVETLNTLPTPVIAQGISDSLHIFQRGTDPLVSQEKSSDAIRNGKNQVRPETSRSMSEDSWVLVTTDESPSTEQDGWVQIMGDESPGSLSTENTPATDLDVRSGAGSPSTHYPSVSTLPGRDYILEQGDPDNQRSDSRAQLLCSLCPTRFTKPDNLRDHMRTHTDLRPYVCTVCHKDFRRLNDQKRCEAVHRGQKFVCNGKLKNGGQWGCGCRFARVEALVRHFRLNSLCIKCLLDEDITERQRPWREHQMQNTHSTQQPQPIQVKYPATSSFNGDNHCFTLPTALLAQYPELATMNWSKLPQKDLSGAGARRLGEKEQLDPVD